KKNRDAYGICSVTVGIEGDCYDCPRLRRVIRVFREADSACRQTRIQPGRLRTRKLKIFWPFVCAACDGGWRTNPSFGLVQVFWRCIQRYGRYKTLILLMCSADFRVVMALTPISAGAAMAVFAAAPSRSR